MTKSMMILAFLASLALAQIDSSVKVPQPLHNLAIFGNHKNHPVQKMRIQQELRQLAPLSRAEVKSKLVSQGWELERLELEDIGANLLYIGWGYDGAKQKAKIFVDPATGAVLHREERS